MSRIADSAMPMQMQSRCKAHAKHMQNAECRMHCRMQMQNADCIAELQIRKHSGAISNGLRARSAGPDSNRYAHSAVPCLKVKKFSS